MITGIQNISFAGRAKFVSNAIDSFSASRGLMPSSTSKVLPSITNATTQAEISAAYSKAPLGMELGAKSVGNGNITSVANANSYAASRGIPLDQVGSKLALNV